MRGLTRRPMIPKHQQKFGTRATAMKRLRRFAWIVILIVDPALPYWTRAGVTAGVAETFSFWLEALAGDPLYLAELGLTAGASEALMRLEQVASASALLNLNGAVDG